MKKLIKSIDKKIITALLVIMLLLSTVAAYNIYAAITNEEASHGSAENAPGSGRYYTLEDLKDMYDILCSYHGGAHSALPGANVALEAGGRSTTTTDSGKEIGKLTKSDEGKETALSTETNSSSSPFSQKSYSVDGLANYIVTSTEVARPKEAYILSEMIEEVDGGTNFYVYDASDSKIEYSDIQYAWWTTIAGSKGEIKTPNSFSEEAEAFEAYIKDVATSTDPSTFVEQHYSFEKNGTVEEGTVPAPVIDYEPKYDKDTNRDGIEDEKDKVQISWDSEKQSWTIGPFIVDYVERSFSAGDRPDVEFSAIQNAELYTNLGKVDKEHWKFNWVEGERDLDDDYAFPHENELFYIELDFIEGATAITNLHFDFKYMNAGGKFDYLDGKYFKQTWAPDKSVIETCPGPSRGETTCSHGSTTSHNIRWKHNLKLTSMQENTSQLLAYGIIGARWYENAELDIADITELEHSGSFKIYKKIVDENGNEIDSNTTERFIFQIYKDGKPYKRISCSPNKPYTSQVFHWKEGEKAPAFMVRELPKSDSEFIQYGAVEMTGGLEENTLTFTAKNYQKIHRGKVSITKKQFGTELDGMEFNFILYVGNKIYKEEGKTSEDGTITLKAGETWESNDIEWTGNAPQYRVFEVNLPKNVKLVNMRNARGILLDGKTVNAVFYNQKEQEYEHGTITLKKVIAGETSSNDTFTFQVRVGEETFTETLKAGESWSETFTWEKGTEAPTYEVTEVNIPKGWNLVVIENATGVLSPDTNIGVVAINEETNKNATINITKHTLSNSATDDSFTIITEISGTFKIGDEEIVNGTKKIETVLKAEETVALGPITWKGEAPTYKVTETNIPAKWKLQDITNSSGTLEDGKEIAVLCTNYEDTDDKGKTGSFEIHKQIVDNNGNEIADYDGNKEFEFDIYKDGEYYSTETVTPNKPYRSPVFHWKTSEKAPKFSVRENLGADGDYKQYGDIDVTGSLEDKTLVFTAKNYLEEKSGYVSIEKRQIGTGLENMEFSFKLYIDNEVYVEPGKTAEDGTITIKVGENWVSNKINWTTKNAPKYSVSEINLPEGSRLVSIENESGSLIKDETVKVVAKNEKEVQYEKATLKLEKKLDGNVSSDESFSFEVVVGDETYAKSLKAGQSWEETFVREKGTKAPEYEVKEVDIPDGWQLVGIENSKGVLEADQKINVIVINEAVKEQSAAIKIHKETESDDKEGVDENNDVFTFVTRISGTFEMSGESIVNGTKTITSTLKSGDTVTLDTVKWKGQSPTYTVTEVELPDGWKQTEISNDSGILEDETVVEVNCINEYRIREEYDLTMEMAGMVWEDVALKPEDKNTEDSKPNGKYDAGNEQGIEKVEVVIWKKCYDANGNEILDLRKYATGYEEGSDIPIEFPIYTSVDGVWKAPRMAAPGLTDTEKEAGAVRADYDVEFTYDGQTYKPTDFLVSGNVEEFRKATNAAKSKYLNDSMAYEAEGERQEFDNKFETITGDTSIDDNGVTEGYAVGSDGNRTDLLYYSTDSMPTVEGNTRKISELQTLEEGYVRDAYKMSSRTSTGGLTYPFDNKVHLESVKKEIDKIEGGLIVRYKYSATYPYLLNVNLGLVKRDEAALSLTKDVYSASVAVNQKLLNYKYNEYVDFESEEYKDYLNLQLKVADANIAYKLDLYESDYYYRAQVYDGNSELKGALQDFYKSLNKLDLSEELDLDVFLTYKISIYNNSDSYLAQVKSVTDYFDEDLELVDSEVTKYVQEADGAVVDRETVVATPAYVIKKGRTDGSMWGEQLRESIQGRIYVDNTDYVSSQELATQMSNSGANAVSDNVKAESGKSYNKATIDLNKDNYRLAAGEKLEVYVTFKVKTDEAPAKLENGAVLEAVNSYVRLGSKANVAEIASYTTYYHDKGTVAGKIDKDSAPNNIDIENKNEKAWYEDDTDSAPIITLDLYNESRDVSGFAWEDKQTEKIAYNQVIGNGLFDEGERLIGNLTTQMVEKVTVKQADGTYRDYDFVWPTDKQFDFLNGKTLKEITGFDSITLTSNSPENTGSYKFTNVPAGNYVVRFEYGNFPADSIDSNGNTIRLDGVPEAKTSDDNSRVPAVYNGQDFKTTAYQSDIINENGKSDYASNQEGYIDNEWYDFTTAKYDENGNVINHNSDVIDNEARRLEVIAYSKVLDNEVTSVLATANDFSADHTELYKNTSMFADTAKINLNIENMKALEGQKVVVTDERTGQTVEVVVGETENVNNTLTNTVIGKSDINGEKGTVSIVNYNYKIEAIDAGFEERSNTEFVLDKEIESITLTTNTGDQILKAVYDIDYEFKLDEETGKSNYKAKVDLNNSESYGTTNLMAQNKDEEAGLQNFRYIYYDDTISQSLNLEVVYKFSVLNVGEVDRTGKVAQMSAEDMLAKAQELKDKTYNKVGNKLISTHPLVGEYLGSIYYLGERGSYSQPDELVTTKAIQLIDYVDNDVVFKAADNTEVDSSWKSVTADELLANKVIDSSIIEEVDGANTVVDDRGVAYTTTQRNNLVLSVDGTTGDKLANPGFIVDLLPYAASKENKDATSVACEAAMKMVITRSIDSQIDEDDLSYDNIAEIVKLENTVGKRDIMTVAGNVNPKGGKLGEGEFAASLDERDSSATELITFTPPYGLGVKTSLTIEVLIVGLAALAIIGTGIVLIKKYVIK